MIGVTGQEYSLAVPYEFFYFLDMLTFYSESDKSILAALTNIPLFSLFTTSPVYEINDSIFVWYEIIL